MKGFPDCLSNQMGEGCISISPREMKRSLTLGGFGYRKGTGFTAGKNSEGAESHERFGCEIKPPGM